MSRTTIHEWKCDRCGATDYGSSTTECPAGWGYVDCSHGAFTASDSSDLCPTCTHLQREFLAGHPMASEGDQQ